MNGESVKTVSCAERSKVVSNLIENNVLAPLSTAVDTFSQLEELARTIRDTARMPIDDRSDHQTARRALTRIATLAEVAAYMAADIGNFVDCERESVEKEHLQTILNEVGVTA